MTKQKIFVDMDGILTDLMGKWLRIYNEKHDDNVTPDDIKHWEMSKFVKIPEDDFYAIPKEPGFFDDLNPLPGAVEGFKALRNSGHHVAVCSSPFNDDSARAKYAWCAKHLGLPRRDVILMHKKPWLAGEGRILIDDKPRHLVEWEKGGGKAMTITYPYNADVDCSFRADGFKRTANAWQELVKELT